MQKAVATCVDWGKIPASLKLYYEDLAFDSWNTIGRIAAHLGVACAAERVMKHVFTSAPTQKNKGIRKRYLSEMSDAENALFAEQFGDFIEHVCERQDYSRFSTREFSWLQHSGILLPQPDETGEADHALASPPADETATPTLVGVR